jgi:hypothetical protein
MVETLLEYVPYGQRENARAAAIAIGIGYAYERTSNGTRGQASGGVTGGEGRPDGVP